ncbi:hypothetical protein [Flavobacterium pectinovorum]|uniref:N-acetyltransferase n=1 Tax=Flavobacterium pectinovorum TaxID=29533 RepID=A0A502EVT9_9FLAO|nr:hypothetical protein [Flavobacterium pectinovorum]TPG42045.1 hypothetical protein EAH81_06895 [Flavobacterium pectinovorum]
MNVKILKIDENSLIDAKISDVKSVKINLPSITDGWRFNFKKHSKEVGHETYVLVSKETPDVIEGCLIFEMKKKVEPYMAYVEIAPHNKGLNKRYEKVAGCLIAFACRLSFIKANEPYRGYLVFDVMEEDKSDEVKLMAMYSTKYNALRYGEATMIIPPAGGEKLITEFLN